MVAEWRYGVGGELCLGWVVGWVLAGPEWKRGIGVLLGTVWVGILTLGVGWVGILTLGVGWVGILTLGYWVVGCLRVGWAFQWGWQWVGVGGQ